MAIQKLQPNFKFNEEQLFQLRQIVPEVFRDNIIDFDILYEALSGHIEDDGFENEHFGLSWPGKLEAKKITSTPSFGTLAEVKETDYLAESTSNVFIEGENLAVLKTIKKSYANSIKAIYIDPPYNTGNDLIYDDDFTETVEEFLKRIGSTDESGRKLTTNTKADGRFHSKWLTMIYPRLKIAHQLLKDDGVIFISIDDNELNNLRLVMNELFGEENFIGNFIVQSNPRGSQSSRDIGIVHEYVVVYSKNISNNAALAQRLNERMVAEYKYNSDDGRKYRLLGLRQRGGAWRREQRPSLYFPIFINPDNGKISLKQDEMFTEEVLPIKPTTKEDGSWRWSKKKIIDNINDLIGKQVKREGIWAWDVSQLDYLSKGNDDEKSTKPKSIWNEPEMNYQNAGNEIKELFGHSDVFDFPKPTYLIKKILNLIDCDGEIVLDFFAGSGTTGQAVYELNSEGRNIRFICVQLDYKISESKRAYKLGYKTISEVTSKRLELSSKKYQVLFFEGSDFLLGFRYFKLMPSNFKIWNNFTEVNISQLETLFSQFESSLIENWEPENLLTEILLIEGFPLDSKVLTFNEFKKNNVQKVTSDFCEHALFICLDKKVEDETIKALSLRDTDIFICLDNAVTDQDKARLDDKGLIKTI